MTEKAKGLLEIHAAVLLFGISGLFPKLIHLPIALIVLGRSFVAAFTLGILLILSGKSLKLNSRKHLFMFGLLGAVYALNAFAFYQSIKVSTVAIGVLSSGTFPVFVALLEPCYSKESMRFIDIVLALITFVGVALIVPRFTLQHQMTMGVCWGLVAGFAFANFSILNRKYVQQYSSHVIFFYQALVACIAFIPALFASHVIFRPLDGLLILLLGTVFTAGSHSLFIKGMTHVKAQTASMITNLEPLYAALLAFLFLKETPVARTLLGGSMIIGATILATLSSTKEDEVLFPEG